MFQPPTWALPVDLRLVDVGERSVGDRLGACASPQAAQEPSRAGGPAQQEQGGRPEQQFSLAALGHDQDAFAVFRDQRLLGPRRCSDPARGGRPTLCAPNPPQESGDCSGLPASSTARRNPRLAGPGGTLAPKTKPPQPGLPPIEHDHTPYLLDAHAVPLGSQTWRRVYWI